MPVPEAGQALVAAVGRATQAYQRATDGFDDAVGRALGLNPTDLRCLDWLTEGPMSAGELGTATGLSSAATTTMLDRLERKGFVRRERGGPDRRKVMVELTPHGRRVIGELYGPLAADGAALLGRFSDEQLVMMRDFLVSATELVDAHRARLRGSGERSVRAHGAPDRAGSTSPARRRTARPASGRRPAS
jgi:DNA-binding MarR family transcriptional regulator